jgi:hypothetical protein
MPRQYTGDYKKIGMAYFEIDARAATSLRRSRLVRTCCFGTSLVQFADLLVQYTSLLVQLVHALAQAMTLDVQGVAFLVQLVGLTRQSITFQTENAAQLIARLAMITIVPGIIKHT